MNNLVLQLFLCVLLKTIRNFDLPSTPTRFTFPSNKILLKKIEAVLLFQTVMTDTKLKKKRHYCKINTLHLSLRSISICLVEIIIYN